MWYDTEDRDRLGRWADAAGSAAVITAKVAARAVVTATPYVASAARAVGSVAVDALQSMGILEDHQQWVHRMNASPMRGSPIWELMRWNGNRGLSDREVAMSEAIDRGHTNDVMRNILGVRPKPPAAN